MDDVVFVDDMVRFQAKLLARGFSGQDVTVRLKERDVKSTDPKDARVIETSTVKAPVDGQPKRIELGHRPKQTGEVIYTLEIEPQKREIQTENNRIERTVNVRKEKLKVLFVDNEPRYEFRYLKNYLEREETINLSVVLLSSDQKYGEQDRSALSTFPAAKDELFAYDVVLLGDADPTFLSQSQMQNLVEFVTQKGGGILFIAGENFDPLSYRGTPLEVLLPIELAEARNPTALGNALGAFRPELTLEGRGSPIFRFGDDEASSNQVWQNLPELFWLIEAPRKKPAAVVLAEHPTLTGSDGKLPIMVYQFVGAGKSMLNTVDDTWRWRFRVGDRYFGRYWIQTIRFLARSKLLGQKQAELATDRRRYQRNQPIQFRVRFPNPAIAPPSSTRGQRPDRAERAGAASSNSRPRPVQRTTSSKVPPPPRAPGGGVYGPAPAASPSSKARSQRRLSASIPPAGELERPQMNEPELLRVGNRRAVASSTPRKPFRRC